MKEVQLHDKHFELFISSEEILTKVADLAKKIEVDYQGKEILFLSILNGSFMFTSDLMKNITRQAEISFIKVSSYSGTSTTGRVDELIGLATSITDKHIIVVEDIVDTGITIDKVITLLNASNPASISICTFLYKPSAFKGNNIPDYVGFEIPNKFVVGYGLDYNQLGRNLDSLYELKNN
ncbi:MAG: hypoxanthine phosphoribosyltransferase [Flavobacteriia bacterium]|nr:hypoxanthine phosphoribosyltransferase [Flavobacteriia bacterium]